MLRITELRLPLDHADDALRPAIVARLGLRDTELTAFTVFKRSYDARKKTAIVLIYTVDCQLAVDDAAVLARFAGDAHVKPSPDTRYGREFMFCSRSSEDNQSGGVFVV